MAKILGKVFDEMIGQTISHYKILEKLGEGGMGVVYKAQDLKLDRFVALKFLPQHLGADEKEKQRFIQEAKAASALDHTNIANIHNIDETEDGQIFICMAYYEGETIKDKIERGPLPLAQAVEFATQVAQGLSKVHAKGIVHRDIKPANVMVTNDGTAKICDFGIAKLASITRIARMSTTLGTPSYISPEQTRGKEVDHRADIWSLGVVLYEMLTGKLPFHEENEQALMYAILHEEPEPITALRPEVPVSLERVVAKTMAKDPEERYLHLEAMLHDLISIQKELQLGTMQASFREKPRSFFYTSAAILLVLILTGALFLWQQKNTVVMPSEKGAAEKAAAFEMNRIAVLPLENRSPAAEDEYLADGITEELISVLSKIGALRVIARTSVMRYKGVSKSIAEIGRELRVTKILEGSVSKSENRLRLAVRLINVETQDLLWSQTYNREMKDIFVLPGDIATQVAYALQVQLMEGESFGFEATSTKNLGSHELYLKGRHYWNQRTQNGLTKAREYFEQAIQRDPRNAKAHAGLADCYSVLYNYDWLPYNEAYPKAKSAAQRALELDSTLAEAHAALGFVYYDGWNWVGAEQEFGQAIKLKPSYAMAHQLSVPIYVALGRMTDAIAAADRALELDPLSLPVNMMNGAIYFFSRQYDHAIEQWRKMADLFPGNYYTRLFLPKVYLQQGRYDEAIKDLLMADSLSRNSFTISELAHAYAVAGRNREAYELLNELIAIAEKTHVPAFLFAKVYLGLGQKGQAITWLERACAEHHSNFWQLSADPAFDGLRKEPRFKALLKKVGLRNNYEHGMESG